jgi:hypothetical protein
MVMPSRVWISCYRRLTSPPCLEKASRTPRGFFLREDTPNTGHDRHKSTERPRGTLKAVLDGSAHRILSEWLLSD